MSAMYCTNQPIAAAPVYMLQHIKKDLYLPSCLSGCSQRKAIKVFITSKMSLGVSDCGLTSSTVVYLPHNTDFIYNIHYKVYTVHYIVYT